MLCDADDLISNKLNNLTLDEQYDAMILKAGYTWRQGSKYLILKKQFNHLCGTSFIMKLNKSNFPNWLDNKSFLICDQSHSTREHSLIQNHKIYSYTTSCVCY